jgi:exopolysaccharide biosynthesis polyprenyl glycosylphosphotransferase
VKLKDALSVAERAGRDSEARIYPTGSVRESPVVGKVVETSRSVGSTSERDPVVSNRTMPSDADDGLLVGAASPTFELGQPRIQVLHFLPRVVGDITAAAVGLAVFSAAVHAPNVRQMMYVGLFVAVAAVMDVTHVRREWNYVEEFVFAFKAAFIGVVLLATVGLLVNRPISRILFVATAGGMLLARPLAAIVADRISDSTRRTQRILTVCTNEEHREFAQAVREAALLHVRLERAAADLAGPDADRAASALLEAAGERPSLTIVVGPSHMQDANVQRAMVRLNETGVQIRSLARIYEEVCGRVSIDSLDTEWFLFDMGPTHRIGYRIGRRVIDLIAGLVVGALFLLLLPFIATGVKLSSRGPVFYVQRRVGQDGREFNLYKIRTMYMEAEDGGPRFTSRRDPRVTAAGAFFRRCRIDELPQAVNLLRGEMSLIGPRPERPEWVDVFRTTVPFYDKRCLIKPGITGWAQVHEGYGDSVEDMTRKLERDLYYLRYQSLGLDLRIALATLGSIVRFSGR